MGLGTGPIQLRRAGFRTTPFIDHRTGHFRVEFDGVDVAVIAEGLAWKVVALRQMSGAGRDLKCLRVPLIEHGGGRFCQIIVERSNGYAIRMPFHVE